MMIRKFSVILVFVLVIVLASTACAGAGIEADADSLAQRQDLIAKIKEYEKGIGFRATKTFQKYSGKQDAYYLCYYTGIFELPDSYEGLKFKDGNKDGCDIDEQKYDVLFHAAEAIAGEKTPITPSLLRNSTERFIMTVIHEDFHEQVGENLPTGAMNESFSTFIGLAAASQFARDEFGETSQAYVDLSDDTKNFLQAARIANGYHKKLNVIFKSHHDGTITARHAATKKAKVFLQLQKECSALPAPNTVWRCPGFNNAHLAFSVTYSRHYPLAYELYMAKGQDLAATMQAILEVSQKRLSEEEAVDYLQSIINQSSKKPSS